MADHSEVAYTTADGNDYPEHERTYEGFVELAFVGSLYVIATVLGIGTSADDDHPLVIERPDLFGDDAPLAHLRTPKMAAAPAEEAPVERATRAPGERRQAVKKTTPGTAGE